MDNEPSFVMGSFFNSYFLLGQTGGTRTLKRVADLMHTTSESDCCYDMTVSYAVTHVPVFEHHFVRASILVARLL